MTDLSQLIEPEILSQISDERSNIRVEEKQLELTHNRFDLAFKLYFLEGLEQGKFSEFRRECYRQHIKAFSDGTFSEPNNPEKNSYEHFERTLIELLNEIREHGFDSNKSIIPLAENASILNGAHRTAVSILFKKKVGAARTKLPARDFDYQYFQHRGVTTEMLDMAAQTFIAYDKRSFLAFIWPAAQGGESEIEKILSPLVYKKSISLNYNGAHNLLAQAYSEEPWLGAESDNFPGIKNKLVECFPTFDDVRVYLFQANSLEDVLELKDKVRDVFKIGKHAIHITDTQEETLRLGRLVFNTNGLHFLNFAKPRLLPCITENQCKEYAKNNELLTEALTMHLYGLKALQETSIKESRATVDRISTLTSSPENELEDNPEHFFYYNNMKIMSLSLVQRIQKARRTSSDKQTLKLITPLMKHKRLSKQFDQLKSRSYFFKLRLATNIKVVVASLLKKLGLFELIKRILNRN
ncbi:hypothetical protein HII17_02620 [Thalassotalea sp. M1531]|uniref:Uncharacterized protein n=1 Tax=Thalassotalea algicola TaxID=2716224 RepID=A0A7Y0LCA1_9GAMM|nr:hypothetical protein [Thalassotalea algicola]NMP30445.1 hypothetical protein [Thalassotalea algicola]